MSIQNIFPKTYIYLKPSKKDGYKATNEGHPLAWQHTRYKTIPHFHNGSMINIAERLNARRNANLTNRVQG